MNKQGFDPKDVTTPIQLIAALLLALLAFGGLFLKGAHDIHMPWWAPNVLVLSAVALVATGAVAVFLLLTLFRPQTLSDAAYLQLRVIERRFRHFTPERTQGDEQLWIQPASGTLPGQVDELEPIRCEEYERVQGLFICHSWRPSNLPNQKADITVRLVQHGQGPLSRGEVEKVEYELGRKFFPEPLTKMDARDGYRLDISAYAPVLCLGRVHFNTERPPLDLFRYLDFPVEDFEATA